MYSATKKGCSRVHLSQKETASLQFKRQSEAQPQAQTLGETLNYVGQKPGANMSRRGRHVLLFNQVQAGSTAVSAGRPPLSELSGYQGAALTVRGRRGRPHSETRSGGPQAEIMSMVLQSVTVTTQKIE